jgi:hypothetical protein
MTNVQLRAEVFREINPLLDNESAMKRVLVFLRTLTPVAIAQLVEEVKPKKLKLEDLEIPAKLRRKRGCIRLTEEDLKDERIQYILKK